MTSANTSNLGRRTKSTLIKTTDSHFWKNRDQIEAKKKSRCRTVRKTYNITKCFSHYISHSVNEAIRPKLISELEALLTSDTAVKDTTHNTQMAIQTTIELKL